MVGLFGVAWDRWLLLIMVALFVLGPERLPAAARWLGQTTRRVKSFATDAQAKLSAELGPEFDELRKPLAELPLADLRRLRSPRAAMTEFLFADPPATPAAAGSAAPPQRSTVSPAQPTGSAVMTGDAAGRAGRPPIDPDAT